MATTTTTKKVVILSLKGDIDIEDIIALKDIVTSFIEKESYFFDLDFEHATHINVSGIEFLNERKERIRSFQGDIKIVGANDYVKNLFIYAGYWGEFEFHPSENEAVKAFESLI